MPPASIWCRAWRRRGARFAKHRPSFLSARQINGKVKILGEGGQAEDIKEGEQQDPEAKVGIACPLCGALFDMRTGAARDSGPGDLGARYPR